MKLGDSQQDFLSRLGSLTQILELFDLLPDVSFFMKDRDGRFVALNRRGREYCGVRTEREAFHCTDRDFFPKARAEEYMADDRIVMETGRPILNRVEPAPEMEGSPRLVVTNKIPLRDAQGQVIGVAGFSREVDRTRVRATAIERLARAVNYLHDHFAENIATKDLATLAGLSTSQFERTFQKTFGASPRQYLLRVRVEAACRELTQSEETVAAIALQCGFYDHAHFTRCFRQVMGVSPAAYRRERRGA